MNIDISKIPEETKRYLEKIAEKLWSGHAALMVGSGLSKNATRNDPSQIDFPDWNQLGDLFYRTLLDKGHSNNERYLDVLKLAEQVEVVFDRPTLDHLLCSAIPDMGYTPSELHSDLLKLPWTDVLTTNYDTLLERARINVYSRKYDVVIRKEELVYSEKPRIIKLHGSFPSGPFIISEEDYRQYPKNYAPFINTVQQTLLENTLCLVGFSGDDPNFCQWISWIIDNLGKDNSPKIYLINVSGKLSFAQKRLLEERRNIRLVDLTVIPCHKGDPVKAIRLFLDYLQSKRIDDKLDWPYKSELPNIDYSKDKTLQMKNAIKEWEKQRVEYPNWIILPEERRTSLWYHTNNWIPCFIEAKKLDAPLDIQFIYELNWRIEKCLCPIFNDYIDSFKTIIEKYNPFPNELNLESASVINGNKQYDNINWEKLKIKWIELHISLMRYYREEGLLEEWKKINKRLLQIDSILSPELIAQLHYERCLFALFSLKIDAVKDQIQKWPSNNTLPYWEAKRALLIAELGDINESVEILETSLSNIRKKLNLSPVMNDYSLVSKESYIMLLLRYVKDAELLKSNQYQKREQLIKEFNERWNSIKQYNCDPWNEAKLFGKTLEKEPAYKAAKSEIHEFDIGIKTVNHFWGDMDPELLSAYSFLRYCEEIGIPFRIPGMSYYKEHAKGAVKRIKNYSPYWALASFVRIGDANAAEIIFSREYLSKMTVEQVDSLAKEYLQVLKDSRKEIEKGGFFDKKNFGVVLAEVLPEALSRLCTKCSIELKDKIFDFVNHLYASRDKDKYGGIDKLITRLLGSYSNKELYERLTNLLNIPIPTDLNNRTEIFYVEPFDYIRINKNYLDNCKGIYIDQEVIDALLNNLSSNDIIERKRAISRLSKLYEYNLLNEAQIALFANNLWAQIDNNSGFPKNSIFPKSAFLYYLPYPEIINPIALFKEYIDKEKIPIQKTKKEKGIEISMGDIPFCREIVSATKKPLSEKGIDWSEQEVVNIFLRLLEWWDSDKEFIKDKEDTHQFGYVGDEFKKRFSNLVNILTYVIIPRISSQSPIKENIGRILTELYDYGIPCVAAYAASITIFPEWQQDIINKIDNAILSSQKEKIYDGYVAIYNILILAKTKKIETIPCNINLYISLPIKLRYSQNLGFSLNYGKHIVNDFPEMTFERVHP